jgi:hypothetical protein
LPHLDAVNNLKRSIDNQEHSGDQVGKGVLGQTMMKTALAAADLWISVRFDEIHSGIFERASIIA